MTAAADWPTGEGRGGACAGPAFDVLGRRALPFLPFQVIAGQGAMCRAPLPGVSSTAVPREAGRLTVRFRCNFLTQPRFHAPGLCVWEGIPCSGRLVYRQYPR